MDIKMQKIRKRNRESGKLKKKDRKYSNNSKKRYKERKRRRKAGKYMEEETDGKSRNNQTVKYLMIND